jgi:hypothetical protein
MPTHTITIPPTPITDALDVSHRIIFDHGAELVIRLTLTYAGEEPDHVTGTIELISDTRINDSAPA